MNPSWREFNYTIILLHIPQCIKHNATNFLLIFWAQCFKILYGLNYNLQRGKAEHYVIPSIAIMPIILSKHSEVKSIKEGNKILPIHIWMGGHVSVCLS